MKKILKMFACCLLGFMWHSMSLAASDKGTAEEAIAMVKKAVNHIKQNGKEKAFADFSDPTNTTFHDRDLYIYVYDMNGVALAHGANPRIIGKNLYELKDADGKKVVQELIDIAKTKSKGWSDFKWPNPVTKNVEQKSGYIEAVDGAIFVGCGIYKQ